MRIFLAVEVLSLRDTPEICIGDVYQQVREKVRHRGHKHWHKHTSHRLENSAIKDLWGSGQVDGMEEEGTYFEYELERWVMRTSVHLIYTSCVALISQSTLPIENMKLTRSWLCLLFGLCEYFMVGMQLCGTTVRTPNSCCCPPGQ